MDHEVPREDTRDAQDFRDRSALWSRRFLVPKMRKNSGIHFMDRLGSSDDEDLNLVPVADDVRFVCVERDIDNCEHWLRCWRHHHHRSHRSRTGLLDPGGKEEIVGP